MVIGIGGISRSGKTKLAKKLRTYFNNKGESTILISCDDFHVNDFKLPEIKEMKNREIPISINYKKILTAIAAAKNNAVSKIIVEGHLIYANKKLAQLFNCSIFFRIDKPTFIERKIKDNRNGELPHWYIEYSWRAWQQYGQIDNNIPFLSIDGNRKLPFKLVLDYIYQYEKNIHAHHF